MTTIFVSRAPEDAACAEHLRAGLEAQGYRTWREPASLSLESVLYPHAMEQAILSSAKLVLLWSAAAAQSEWVERQLVCAQRLKKAIVSVALDGTALPTTLVAASSVVSQGPCADLVTQVLPLLPDAQNTDVLTQFSEQAGDTLIRVRKEAIDLAAHTLQAGTLSSTQREAMLAALEELAAHDLMTGVREKAQAVLDAQQQPGTSVAASLRPADSRHIFGVRCKNGHVSSFDKRLVCRITEQVARGVVQRAGKELDELHLTCTTTGCGLEVVACVDCEGYK